MKNLSLDDISVDALLISAGRSGRIGVQKALLPYHGKTFISCIVQKLFSTFSRLVIVVGYEADKIKSELTPLIDLALKIGNKKLSVVENKDYEIGMFSSIKLGLSLLSQSEYVLIHMIDQPNLPENFYIEFKEQVHQRFDWIQPVYNNRNGHPIIIGEKVIKKILASDVSSNLRTIKKEINPHILFWHCNYKEILTDIDTLSDYNNLFTNQQEQQ